MISDGFQMAGVLYEYFSSVFTTENIISLPVPFTKFEGNKSEHLGQLFVTHEIIAKKLRRRKTINHLELMGYHQICLRKLLSKLVHHLQICLTCH